MEKKPVSKLAIVNLVLSCIPLLFTNIIAVIIGIIFLCIPGFRGKILALISIIIGTLITLIIIPNMLSGRIDLNVTTVGSVLKHLNSCESIWAAQDPDQNGIKDYWTYDISCLHRMYRSDGESKVAFLPLDAARADTCPADIRGGKIPFGDKLTIESFEPFEYGNRISYPRSGYWFRAMLLDENGIPYNQNPVGTNRILATNSTKYAFVAYPDVYGTSGIETLIINEQGSIYWWDSEGVENKIVLQWPKPEEFKGTKPKWQLWD